MTTASVVRAIDLCPDIPRCEGIEILRDNLLDAVDRIFSSGTSLVVVEGDEGIGVSTFLMQYANRHSRSTVGAFIRPVSRLAYAPDYLRNVLGAQIAWLLEESELGDEQIDQPIYNKLLTRLTRLAPKLGHIDFVVDGILDIPEDDRFAQEHLLRDLLPIGIGNFRFLFSGDYAKFAARYSSAIRTKNYQLSGFAPHDSQTFLAPLSLSPAKVADIHSLCRGFPARLAAVRRLVEAGVDLDSLLTEDLDKLPDFLSLEWRSIKERSERCQQILSLAAFSRQQLTVSEIAQLIGIGPDEVLKEIEGISIVRADSASKKISYATDSHRKFAANQLKKYREKTLALLISSLNQGQEPGVKARLLPGYLEQAGQLDLLLEQLGLSHFTDLLVHTESTASVSRHLEIGFETARHLNDPVQTLRFALQQAVITDLTSHKPWLSEIRARIRLKEYDAALAIAQRGWTREGRLQLLASYGRSLHEAGVPPDTAIRAELRKLASEVDFSAFGELAIDIACDLVVFDPDLSIGLLEKAHPEETLDGALFRLSLAAAKPARSQETQDDPAEKARSHIKDESVRKLSSAIAAFFGDIRAPEVIKRVGQLDDRHRHLFLKGWIARNRSQDDALMVVNHALDVLIRDTLPTVTTGDLRELAIALPYSKNTEQMLELVRRFDAQKGLVRKLGSTEDFVRLEMLLASAEAKYDSSAALRRVSETWRQVHSSTDLATRTECLAWIVGSIDRVDATRQLDHDGFWQHLQVELPNSLRTLLDSSADHYLIAKGPIRALARANLAAAISLAASLNIEERRDSAFIQIARVLSDLPDPVRQLKDIAQTISCVADSRRRDALLKDILERLESLPSIQDGKDAIISFIEHIYSIRSPRLRSDSLILATSIVLKGWPTDDPTIERIQTEFAKTWPTIDQTWARLDVGFQMASALAPHRPEDARSILSKVETLRKGLTVHVEETAVTLLLCLDLCIRAFCGLIPKRAYNADHISQIANALEAIPAICEQLRLWGVLTVRSWASGDLDLARQVSEQHLKPLLDALPERNEVLREEALAEVAPALYITGNVYATDLLQRLPQSARDEAFRNICTTLIRKQPHSEPFQDGSFEYQRLTYDSVLEVIDSLTHITADHAINDVIEELARALGTRAAKDWLTRVQRADVVERLTRLAEEKLPDSRNIRHDGYKITCLAHANSIAPTSVDVWHALQKRAATIPNDSDRAIVLAVIAIAMPSKFSKERKDLLRRSAEIVSRIPSILDRTERYIWMADLAEQDEPRFARDFLHAAMQCTFALSSGLDPTEYHSRIFDLAHQIDAAFAKTLASQIDDDPARLRARGEADSHLKLLDVKKRLTAGEAIDEKPETLEKLAEAAWLGLGSLNARRTEPQRLDALAKYIQRVRKLTIDDAHSVIAWVVENANRRLSGNEAQVRTTLLPIFLYLIDAVAMASRFATYLVDRSSTQALGKDRQASNNIVFREGERETAIAFLEKWISENARTHLKICDPFFRKDDLALLRRLRLDHPECRVTIVTGRSHLLAEGPATDEAFRAHWKKISDLEPPQTDILLAGMDPGGECPLHDRWIFSGAAGLRLGTSLNGLGVDRISEISILTGEDALTPERVLDQYILREKRVQNGKRISYLLFSLQ